MLKKFDIDWRALDPKDLNCCVHGPCLVRSFAENKLSYKLITDSNRIRLPPTKLNTKCLKVEDVSPPETRFLFVYGPGFGNLFRP